MRVIIGVDTTQTIGAGHAMRFVRLADVSTVVARQLRRRHLKGWR